MLSVLTRERHTVHDVNLIRIILVTLVASVAGMANVLDKRQFHRLLVVCTLTGITPGDPAVGIMADSSLGLLALSWMNVGATMVPDSALAPTVSTIIAVASVGDASFTKNAIAAAIGVAVPLAVVDQALTIFVRTTVIFFTHQADRFTGQVNYRGVAIMHFTVLGLQGLRVAIPAAVVAVLASGNTVEHALDVIPKVITEGLGTAGGFIVVIGYAMVISMMKACKLMPFFFLGFIFTTSATTADGPASVSDHNKDVDKWVIDLVPSDATLITLGTPGACLAVIYVQLNPEFHDPVRLPAVTSPVTSGSSSSDLDDDPGDELD